MTATTTISTTNNGAFRFSSRGSNHHASSDAQENVLPNGDDDSLEDSSSCHSNQRRQRHVNATLERLLESFPDHMEDDDVSIRRPRLARAASARNILTMPATRPLDRRLTRRHSSRSVVTPTIGNWVRPHALPARRQCHSSRNLLSTGGASNNRHGSSSTTTTKSSSSSSLQPPKKRGLVTRPENAPVSPTSSNTHTTTTTTVPTTTQPPSSTASPSDELSTSSLYYRTQQHHHRRPSPLWMRSQSCRVLSCSRRDHNNHTTTIKDHHHTTTMIPARRSTNPQTRAPHDGMAQPRTIDTNEANRTLRGLFRRAKSCRQVAALEEPTSGRVWNFRQRHESPCRMETKAAADDDRSHRHEPPRDHKDASPDAKVTIPLHWGSPILDDSYVNTNTDDAGVSSDEQQSQHSKGDGSTSSEAADMDRSSSSSQRRFHLKSRGLLTRSPSKCRMMIGPRHLFADPSSYDNNNNNDCCSHSGCYQDYGHSSAWGGGPR